MTPGQTLQLNLNDSLNAKGWIGDKSHSVSTDTMELVMITRPDTTAELPERKLTRL
jgi:hypothetical protein